MPVEEHFIASATRSSVPNNSGKAPTIAAAQHTIADIYVLLYLRRQMGYGHKMHAFQPFVTQHLHEILTFLRVYVHTAQGWINSSLVTAKVLGRGGYFATQLCCRSLAFILNRSKLPDKRLLTGAISRLQDEDIRSDINMHLQTLGKYVSAMDLV